MPRENRHTTPSSDPFGQRSISRRTLLTTAAVGVGAAMVKPAGGAVLAQDATAPQDPSGLERWNLSEVGRRSPFENPTRSLRAPRPAGASMTPLQDLQGILTPSDLHYERHHSGVPVIDPNDYRLRIEGAVDRPTTFTLADLQLLPERSEFRFLECGNNGGRAFAGIRAEQTPQDIDGRVSTSEWTGVSLGLLFDHVGAQDGATWFSAEGYDGDWTGSIPMSERWDDALIAYGQNGEAIRPEQGYPARLLLAGHPGGPNIKWLRRIEVHTSPVPENTAMAFSSIMGAKSIITSPAYPTVLSEPGPVVITGLAWSSRGTIVKVDVSTDGGRTWEPADLQAPALPRCQSRFRYRWNWDGGEAMLMSRAEDDTGYVQETLEAARATREARTDVRHWNNNIRAWAIRADGSVVFGLS